MVETSSTHLNHRLVTRGCTAINYETIKITFFFFLLMWLCPKPYPPRLIFINSCSGRGQDQSWNLRNPNQTAEASRGTADGAVVGRLGETYPRRDPPEKPQAAYGGRQFRRRPATEAGDFPRQGRLWQDHRGRGRCSGDKFLSPLIVFGILSMASCSFWVSSLPRR